MSVPVHYEDPESIILQHILRPPRAFPGGICVYILLQRQRRGNKRYSELQQHRKRSERPPAYESAVSKVLTKANTFSTDIEKVKYVHDYLTNINNYVSGSPLNQSAYSALVLGKTVCKGVPVLYAEA